MPETLVHVASGKVRELFAIDDERLLLVASDRVSTFDVVLPTEIPDKGRILTGLSAFWFARTRGLCPNHLLGLRPDGRSTECRRLEMLPLECVVRGYLAGSGWKDYTRSGSTSGRALPEGLRESERLPDPIFTPSTKATAGHDENIDADQAAALVGKERYEEVERTALALYRFAAEHAAARGILIAGRTRPSRRTPRDSGRPTRSSPVVHSRRSTSSSCATTASHSAGRRRRPAPICPGRSSPARGRATSRRSSA